MRAWESRRGEEIGVGLWLGDATCSNEARGSCDKERAIALAHLF